MLEMTDQISSIDKSGMLDAIAEYPDQIKQALEIAEQANVQTFFKIDDVIITGMGGSAISGEIIKEVFRDKITVPFFVNKEPELPRWAHKDTLTFFVSYSGNTEETLSAFKNACQKHCNIFCISTGGKLKELAEHHQVTHIQLPEGYQPRAANGLILFSLIVLLKRMNVLKESITHDVEEALQLSKDAIRLFDKQVSEKENRAKQIASSIKGTIPQIYSFGIYNPIATRWREQFNENAKVIARADYLSECNHNDIVGWTGDPEHASLFSVIVLRDHSLETPYLHARFKFMKQAYQEAGVRNYIEITPHGKGKLARAVYLMLMGDFTSAYLAINRGIDPTPIHVIDELKDTLATL